MGKKFRVNWSVKLFSLLFIFFSLTGSFSFFHSCSGYLVKPVSFDDFLKIVKQISEY